MIIYRAWIIPSSPKEQKKKTIPTKGDDGNSRRKPYITFGNSIIPVFLKKLNFLLLKIKNVLYILDHFDVMISKIIFKR